MMQLDFSAIRGTTENTNAALQKGQEAGEPVVENTLAEPLISSYLQEQNEHDRNTAMFRQYQKNIKSSETIQAKILIGIRTGESPAALLLSAAKCISLMTSNEVFYNQVENDILSIYGPGLLEPEPLRMELERLNERLKRLEEARKRETGDCKMRIEAAIKSHKKRAADLKNLIEKKGEVQP